ncbi:MAG: D-aminoacylase [Bdellovibrionales bacterium]|nr:D-aminoacylase [Ramlibacter sp.]
MTPTFDLLIRNASIIDGTGAPRRPGDIGISGDRIAAIGDLSAATARQTIDLGGRVAAPGFIDAHTHDDRALLSSPDMTPKVSQGVTTVITGNCGISLAPMPRPVPQPVAPPLNLLDGDGQWFRFPDFASYVKALQDQPAATNCALLVGHTTLRVVTMSDLKRPANEDETARMRELVDQALTAGAIGVSTGLFYDTAVAATTEEVIEVCRPLGEHGGLYCTHMRDEADRIIDSLEETFRIGRETGSQVIISHHKLVGQANYGRSGETLELIEKRMGEQRICLDCYPYTAGSTILSADRAATATRVLVSWSQTLPQYAGRDLADIARELGVSEDEAIERLNPAGAIYFRMDEGDVQRILRFGPTMIGSDGLPHDTAPHPRLWGAFPRVLGHYSRFLGLFPMEVAVHKMTGLTAKNFGLQDRGELRVGAFADLTLFDPETVGEAATYEKPMVAAHGIDTVIVNGQVVWHGGKGTGARPGRVLTHEAA